VVDKVQLSRVLYEGQATRDVNNADEDVVLDYLAEFCCEGIGPKLRRSELAFRCLTIVFSLQHGLAQSVNGGKGAI
jgi:hypothetical protein